LAHDGTLLKLSFAQQTAKTGGAKPKSASQTTLGSMKKNLISAKAAFQKQLDDDGWAGDVADGVSALWGSKNRASIIRKELAGEQDRLNQLAQAAQKGDANFKTKFKQIYGVEYNKQAVEAYNKKPNAANFKKAYGSKYPDIRARVNEYNKSQQEGAEVVKTSAKVTTGVAIGVATGGAGLVALGVAAGATTLASAGVEYSDRYKWTGGGGLRKGTSHKKIWKGAAWDGLSVAAGGAVGKIATTAVKGTTMAAKVGRGAINVAGDTGVGAAQEYSETGKVTVTGVVTNATMGGVGSAVTSGVLKEAKAKIVRNFSSKTKKSTATPAKTSPPTKQVPTTTSETLPKTVKNTETFLASTNKNNVTSKIEVQKNMTETKNVSTGHIYNENGELLAGGSFFHKISVSNLFGSSKTKLSKADLMNQAEKNIAKQTKLGDPGTVHISRKLHDELRSPMIAKEFPSAIDLNNINAHIKSGEVCAVGSGANQKLYVNNNGTAQEIQLSRETFDRLFPQGGFAMTSQKAKNNCWILSKINAMTGSNTGKAELYSMFKELPNGDVQILLPNSNRPITFPKGKPLETNSARQIKEGGAPGVEMVQQAVQATRIQKAEKTPISNIEDCSIEKLNVQEELMGTDPEAVSMLIDNKKFTLKTINDNQYAELEDVLNNFNAKEDIGTVTFEMHARTLVAYNPRTKMVTYHNPYNGGVDITCRLEDLERKFANFAISKPKQKTTANNTTTKTVSEQTQNTVQQATTKPKTGVEVPKSAEQKTKIVRNNFREIAKAADGTPINAMISGDSIVINKNGNNIEIPLSEIKENSFYKNSEVSLYSVNETSTNSYIVIEADKYGTISTRSVKDDDGMYKLMDELDQKAKQKTNSTVTDTNSSTEKVSEHIQSAPTKQKSRVDLNSKSKPGTTQTHNKTSSRLAVPKGFIVNQEVNGRRTLISTDGNARVLMERNGRWMEVNNRGKLIEFTE